MINDGEDGFSIAEILVSLVILSLTAVSLGNIVSNLYKDWKTASNEISVSKTIEVKLATILPEEQKIDDNKWLDSAAFLITQNEAEYRLATPKLDQNAECQYDIVGRRCR